MFVYIDLRHMWHSCCRQRLSLAQARSRFPLATVQLASRRASCTHLTNQYKQLDSKSRIMLKRPRTEGKMKLLRLFCSETSLFWELTKHACPQLFYSSLRLPVEGHKHRFCCLIGRWFSRLELLKDPCVPLCLEDAVFGLFILLLKVKLHTGWKASIILWGFFIGCSAPFNLNRLYLTSIWGIHFSVASSPL